jgi:hypothetical protein
MGHVNKVSHVFNRKPWSPWTGARNAYRKLGIPGNRVPRGGLLRLRSCSLVSCVQEVLWRDGDLRKLPQIERKQALSQIFWERTASRLRSFTAST